MSFNRLTWLGLGIAGFGWLLILGGLVVTGVRFGSVPPPFYLLVAQAVIVSGFGLAVLGALQQGFSALNSFFEAILDRASENAEHASEPIDTPAIDPYEVVEEGKIGERGYVMYADGSVRVETLLGIRRFPSLAEAEAFVGT